MYIHIYIYIYIYIYSDAALASGPHGRGGAPARLLAYTRTST